MPNLKVGESKARYIKASDGSIPTGVTCNVGTTGVIMAPVTGTVVNVTAMSPGVGTANYAAPGYDNASENFTVATRPSLIISDVP